VLNSDEHVDEAPATAYAKLLDEGTVAGSPVGGRWPSYWPAARNVATCITQLADPL
jgi:hypothetical protein